MAPAPILLRAKGRRIPQWKMEANVSISGFGSGSSSDPYKQLNQSAFARLRADRQFPSDQARPLLHAVQTQAERPSRLDGVEPHARILDGKQDGLGPHVHFPTTGACRTDRSHDTCIGHVPWVLEKNLSFQPYLARVRWSRLRTCSFNSGGSSISASGPSLTRSLASQARDRVGTTASSPPSRSTADSTS